MVLVLAYRGFEVCRTDAGHLVVLDPEDTEEERAELVALLASSGAQGALFFPDLPEASRRELEKFYKSLIQSKSRHREEPVAIKKDGDSVYVWVKDEEAEPAPDRH